MPRKGTQTSHNPGKESARPSRVADPQWSRASPPPRPHPCSARTTPPRPPTASLPSRAVSPSCPSRRWPTPGPAPRPGHQALWAPTWLRAGPAAGGCSLPSVPGCCARPGPTPSAAGRTGGSSWALALNGNTGDGQGAVPAVDAGSPPPEPAGSAVTQPPWVLGLLGCWVLLTFAPRCTHTSKFREAQNTLEGRPRSLAAVFPGKLGTHRGLLFTV